MCDSFKVQNVHFGSIVTIFVPLGCYVVPAPNLYILIRPNSIFSAGVGALKFLVCFINEINQKCELNYC